MLPCCGDEYLDHPPELYRLGNQCYSELGRLSVFRIYCSNNINEFRISALI